MAGLRADDERRVVKEETWGYSIEVNGKEVGASKGNLRLTLGQEPTAVQLRMLRKHGCCTF